MLWVSLLREVHGLVCPQALQLRGDLQNSSLCFNECRVCAEVQVLSSTLKAFRRLLGAAACYNRRQTEALPTACSEKLAGLSPPWKKAA